jgi:hypothetical protein
MTLPANIRVNALANFPALVYSTGPIVLSKANGIWTIGYNIAQFITQVPAPPGWANSYVLVWDSTLNTFTKASLGSFAAQISGGSTGARAQRVTTASPIVVGASDQIINCNIPTAATCTLPSSASRAGFPVTFKDLGQAAAHNIVISAAGSEKIDGLASVTMGMNYQAITLVPFNDGTNTGWATQ